MTKAKHTPGPWFIGEDRCIDECWSIVTTTCGEIVANVNDSGQRQPNARLIAAAPDMLDALKGLDAWFDTDEELLLSMTGPERFDHERQVAMIRAAIAKATGEAKP